MAADVFLFIKTKLKCSNYVDRHIKEVQKTHFRKSSGQSKLVEALMGSLTDQKDKPIRTLDDIQIGDRVRLKTGIKCAYCVCNTICCFICLRDNYCIV
jgi:hypothetical protein